MAMTISPSAGPVTTQGIGSGLDIAGIVDKLMSIEQAPLTRLQSQEAAYQTKLSAYGSVSGALATFQTTVAALSDPSAFASFAASIVDSSIASVTVDPTKSSALAAGSHTLRVDSLATSQRTASSAFASSATTVGTGSITIDIGTWNSTYSSFTPNADAGSKTITIDSSNNTLVGIRDAINRAGAGVSAAIVNDGTGNRLVLAGTATGDAHGFRVSTTDSDGGNYDAVGLSQIAFDPTAPGGTPQSQHLADAANAKFALDGLAISKPNNHITDAIDGLVIDLKTVSPTATTFTVARDTTTAAKNVANFVSAYNTIVSGLSSLTAYNSTTKTAGALNGDSSIRLISSRLQALVASVIPTGGSVTTLADVGIKFGSDGKLTLDNVKLTSALASDPDSVGRLFAKTGVPTDALVSYTGSTDKTQVGSHALAVTRIATQGSLVASAAAGLTITAGVNDTVGVTIDNVSATLTLTPGTYANAAALATAVQSKINGTSAFSNTGTSVTVTQSAGVLSITSQRFGAASSVLSGGGNGAANLFGSTPTSTGGADVAGTLDGTAFTGAGQTATGATATSAEGLALTITGGATGARGTVAFNRGVAASINDLLTQFLDTNNGLLSTATAGINQSITDLKKQEDAWGPRLAAIRARYTAQYNAMDSLVASLNSTSSYLTQQITALQNMTNGINSGK